MPKYKGLVFSDKTGRKCIHGTDPTHPYEVVFINGNGIVGVKSPIENGGEETHRVRCILWTVLTEEKTGGNYESLIFKGWERKPNDTHVSVRLHKGEVCDKCGSVDTDAGVELYSRVDEAIAFLKS